MTNKDPGGKQPLTPTKASKTSQVRAAAPTAPVAMGPDEFEPLLALESDGGTEQGQTTSGDDKGAELTAAVFRAAERMEIGLPMLAKIIGTSYSTITRIRNGKGPQITPGNRDGDMAQLFLRLSLALDTMFPGQQASIKKWLSSHNQHLNFIPAQGIQSPQGLVHAVTYLEGVEDSA
jgi:hypothetical protein